MSSVAKPYYNLIETKSSGDKIFVAQTNDPQGYVDMQYPAARMQSQEDEFFIWWELDDTGDTCVEAIMVRNVKLDTLLSEVDYNKLKRI